MLALSVEELRPLPICWPPFWVRILMSGRVGTATSDSWLVANALVVDGNRFASSFRSRNVSTSGLLTVILISRFRTMSGNVGSAIPDRGLWKMGKVVAVEM